jgi:hypothetical protein
VFVCLVLTIALLCVFFPNAATEYEKFPPANDEMVSLSFNVCICRKVLTVGITGRVDSIIWRFFCAVLPPPPPPPDSAENIVPARSDVLGSTCGQLKQRPVHTKSAVNKGRTFRSLLQTVCDPNVTDCACHVMRIKPIGTAQVWILTQSCNFSQLNKKTPWPESVRELYRRSECRL